MRETEMLSIGISALSPAPMSQKTPKPSMWDTARIDYLAWRQAGNIGFHAL